MIPAAIFFDFVNHSGLNALLRSQMVAYQVLMPSEQTRKRNRNRYALLRAIQTHGPQRRTELADKCSIRRSSITGLVDELMTLGVIQLEHPDRPRGRLNFKAGHCYAVGVNVRRRRIELAVVDLHGSLEGLDVVRLDGTESYDDIIAIIQHGVNNLIQRDPDRCWGVGLALPGVVNPSSGTCLLSHVVPSLSGRAVRDELGTLSGFHVIVENDVRASLWADIWFDEPEAQFRNIIYLNIGTGIGSALLMGGRSHAGSASSAGEIGHLRAGDEGRACSCGKSDCLETYASIESICRDIARRVPSFADIHTPMEIVQAAHENLEAAGILDAAMGRIANVLAVLIGYIDPETVVLGNQEAEFYEAVAPLLQKHLHTRLSGPLHRSVDVHISRNAQFTALRGAAGLVIDHAFQHTLPDQAARLNQ